MYLKMKQYHLKIQSLQFFPGTYRKVNKYETQFLSLYTCNVFLVIAACKLWAWFVHGLCAASSQLDSIAGGAAALADESHGERDSIQRSTLFKIWLQSLLKKWCGNHGPGCSLGLFSLPFNMHLKAEKKRNMLGSSFAIWFICLHTGDETFWSIP